MTRIPAALFLFAALTGSANAEDAPVDVVRLTQPVATVAWMHGYDLDDFRRDQVPTWTLRLSVSDLHTFLEAGYPLVVGQESGRPLVIESFDHSAYAYVVVNAQGERLVVEGATIEEPFRTAGGHALLIEPVTQPAPELTRK